VLRGGRVTGHCVPAQESPKSMARLMIGKDLPVCEHGAAKEGGEVRLAIAGLSRAADDPFGTDLRDVDLEVRSGEIVGIAGVTGNGQQELLGALSGEMPLAEKFPVRICGVEAGRAAPGRRRRLGLAFVPEERLGRGAVPSMSLTENAILTAARTRGFVRRSLLDFGAARAFAQDCIRRYDVKCGGPQAQARSLSGGNLQKYIVGREILQDPKVLVVAQPTWGVDVGAAAFIRQSIIDLRNRGCAVLVISEELDELFEICDRIAVIAKGRLSPAKPAAATNVEEIGVWMSGMWPGAEGAAEARNVDA
jgi:simple sugar transport system ATP-binding protein